MADQTPRRSISKLDAIRHLLHASIRLHLAQEDPFVIQNVNHSCEILIENLAKHAGKSMLSVDNAVRPEKRKEFYSFYRRPYNFFKHADKDPFEKLDVFDIVRSNELAIFLNLIRAPMLGLPVDRHWALYWTYALIFFPDVTEMVNVPLDADVLAQREQFKGRTRGEAVGLMLQLAERDPAFRRERDLDLLDVREAAKRTPAS